MLIAADSPFIDNPPNRTVPSTKFPSSLPKFLEKAGLSWKSYGGYAANYLAGVNPKSRVKSQDFLVDAATGKLPNVSWLHAQIETDEHPPYPHPSGTPMGNVTKGMQWTVDQVNALVKGGLWPKSVVFIT
jgi:phospholipase C